MPLNPPFVKKGGGGILLPKKCKQQRQNDADEYGSGDGEVEGKLLLLNEYISGKSAHPRDFLSQEQKKTHQYNKNPKEDEKLSESTQAKHFNSPTQVQMSKSGCNSGIMECWNDGII